MDQDLCNSPIWYQDWADVSLNKVLDCLTTWYFPTADDKEIKTSIIIIVKLLCDVNM